MTAVELTTGAKGIVQGLGMMLLHGTVLALLALILARGARLRPSWQAAVWLVVLAKLVLPWGPALPFSLADVIASLRGSSPPPAITIPAAPFGGPETQAAGPSFAWVVLLALWLAGTAF
ncbi:MAG: hypothetical protein KIT31_41180, partial [Deltaproteobacteria bacterium]|nr:hypothetical protein [Deltaproteobacteria bacterium]